MDNVTDQYPRSFFKNRHRLQWRAPIVADALDKTFDFTEIKFYANLPMVSIIDVGCATGELVLELFQRGFNAGGLEGSRWAFKFMKEEVVYRIFHTDIREKIREIGGHGFDLVLSFEVAEHIEEEYADVYVDNLCQLGTRILITAATPGQEGHHHVNCQPHSYWEQKFRERGFERNQKREQIFRDALAPWRKKRELTSYRKNCLIFEKQLEETNGSF